MGAWRILQVCAPEQAAVENNKRCRNTFTVYELNPGIDEILDRRPELRHQPRGVFRMHDRGGGAPKYKHVAKRLNGNGPQAGLRYAPMVHGPSGPTRASCR